MLTTKQKWWVEQIKEALESYENTGNPLFLGNLYYLAEGLYDTEADPERS